MWKRKIKDTVGPKCKLFLRTRHAKSNEETKDVPVGLQVLKDAEDALKGHLVQGKETEGDAWGDGSG